MMLFSMMTAAQNGNAVSFMSRHFGFNHFQTTHIIRQFIPQFMQGLEANFANKGGISSLLKIFDHKVFIQYYNDPDMYLNPQVRYQGLEIMEKVFGSKEEQRSVINRVYLSTGVEIQNLQTLLPFISVLTLSSLYAKAQMALHPNFNAAPQIAHHASPNHSHDSASLPHMTTQRTPLNGFQARATQQAAIQNQHPHYQGKQHQGELSARSQGYFAADHKTPSAHSRAQPPSDSQMPAFQAPAFQAPAKRQSSTLQHALASREHTRPDMHSGSQNQTGHFDIHNEPLPNIIVQAQEAYAKRMKRQQFHPKHWMRSQSQFPQSQFAQSQSSSAQFANTQQTKPSPISRYEAPLQTGKATQQSYQQPQTYQAPVAQQNRDMGYTSQPPAGFNTYHNEPVQTGTSLTQASYGQMQAPQFPSLQVHSPQTQHYNNHSATYQNPVSQQNSGYRPQTYMQAAAAVQQSQAHPQAAFRPAPRVLPSRLEAPGQKPPYGPHEVRPIHDNEPHSYAHHDMIEFIESVSHRPFQHRKYTSLREKLSSQLPWYDSF